MKEIRFRLLACTAIAVLLTVTSGCGSPKEASETTQFGPVRTGSYIPRPILKKETKPSSKTKKKAEKAKRKKERVKEKAAATRPADDDYVTRGGFR